MSWDPFRGDSFHSLQYVVIESKPSNLEEIVAVLRYSAEVRGVKKLILRTDLLGKVRKYDKTWSDILQVSQVCQTYY
jgi:hypothetical protein